MSFERLEAFENEDSTRSFLSILVDQGFEQVITPSVCLCLWHKRVSCICLAKGLVVFIGLCTQDCAGRQTDICTLYSLQYWPSITGAEQCMSSFLNNCSIGTRFVWVQVCRAIRRTDRAFAEHGLQLFHNDPRPHVSLMWALGSMSQRLVALSQEVQAGLSAALQEHPWECDVAKIECRVGQRVYAVWEAAGS